MNYHLIQKLKKILLEDKVTSEFLSQLAGELHAAKKQSLKIDSAESLALKTSLKEKATQLVGDELSFIDDLTYKFFLSDNFLSDYLSKNKLSNDEDRKKFEKAYYEWYQILTPFQSLVFFILKEKHKQDIFLWINGEGERDFWFIYHPLVEILPILEITIEELKGILPDILEKSKNDMTNGMIFNSIEGLAHYQPAIGLEFLNEIIEKSSSLKMFIAKTLSGLSKSKSIPEAFDKSIDLIKSDDFELRKSAILGASIIQYDIKVNQDQIQHLTQTYNTIYEVEKDEFQSVLAESYGNLLNVLSDSKDKILNLSQSDDPQTQYTIADVLWRKVKYSEDPIWYTKVLMNLRNVKSEHNRIIKDLEYALIDVLKESPQTVLDFLENWIAVEGRKSEDILTFTYLYQEIHRTNYDYFTLSITDWLNKDDYRFHTATEKILSEFHSGQITLNLEYLHKQSIQDLRFIVCKILGFVHSVDHLKPMLYSFIELKTRDKNFKKFLVSAFNYIGLDYPSMKDYLISKKQTAQKNQIQFINEVIRNIDKYFEDFTSTIGLLELRPSEKRLNQYFKAQNKVQAKFFQESQEKENTFLSMVKNVNLKSGGVWFSKVNGEYSNKSKMGKFQASGELPRKESIDPIGQVKMRIYYRTLKKSL
ncbi:hypothetical protein FNH22_03700 [Fulvivirga sp. M361]|uniref:hypothetical protein n=1 Tax=Fulvivirga sp. M361 TaxID=2594266 RepID=UPI001179F8F7|nr:hypothetical protein [Fulvivirga sp. M361]TRX61170.1 hypothetical protein FNH22_03700 [Fulvivirga sp. M361]